MAISIGNGLITGVAGVSFPASQVASADVNTLDDYEEGTWTGNLRMHSTYSNTTPTGYNTSISSTGRYIKIGKLCLVENYFDVTAYSNYVAYYIDGLPFTSGPGTGAGYPIACGHLRGMRFVYSTSINTDATLAAVISPNSTTINLQSSYNGSAFSGWFYISNEAAQGKYIHVNGVYETA